MLINLHFPLGNKVMLLDPRWGNTEKGETKSYI